MVMLLSGLVLAVLVACKADPAKAGRVALVIGNAQYENTQPLANPRNDAEAMSAVLRRLGFEVFDGYDLKRSDFENLIRAFARGARDADAAVLYYAGHGLEVGNANYLIPVDANIRDETDLKFEAIGLSDILGFMEREQRTNLVFLDACRDNPMARNLSLNMGTRSVAVGRGLAPVETGVGTLIAYSTQPGNVALDGDGRHSPFTAALLDHIATPDVDIEIMMRHVRRDVMQKTGGEQVPWSSSSLTGGFFFDVRPEQTKAAAPELSAPAQAAAGKPASGAPEASRVPAPAAEIVVSALNPAEAVAPPMSSKPTGAATQVIKPELSARDLARLSQAQLNRLGCEAGTEDGIWGRKSRVALERFGEHAPSIKLASLEPTEELLRAMEGLNGRICPLECAATEDLIDNACIRKTCPSGQKLSSAGACYTPKASGKRRPSSSGSGSGCFSFNGQTYCQ